MERVIALLDAGVPFSEAVKIALAERDRAQGDPAATAIGAISRFADRHADLQRANTSSTLHLNRAMTWPVAVALADELGGTAGEWRDLHARLRGAHEAARAG